MIYHRGHKCLDLVGRHQRHGRAHLRQAFALVFRVLGLLEELANLGLNVGREPERADAIRRGLGALDADLVARLELPQRRAPKALTGRDDTRWQRAAQAAPPRDRALAAVMRYAGTRISETVGIDLDDLPTTQRRQRLRIRGKGRKNRSIPVHPELAASLNVWLTTRRAWPGADNSQAVFLNRHGTRLSARSADEIIAGIAAASALSDIVTPHVLRHTFGTDLIRAGTDLVTVAELLGHASLDSTRIYTLPTDDDLQAAIDRLTVDR